MGVVTEPVVAAQSIGKVRVSVRALGSVRLTLGRGTKERDVERAAEALARSWRMLTTG